MALHELRLDKLQQFTLLATTTITGTASSAVTCFGFGLKKYG